jgi:hypothetical protein
MIIETSIFITYDPLMIGEWSNWIKIEEFFGTQSFCFADYINSENDKNEVNKYRGNIFLPS